MGRALRFAVFGLLAVAQIAIGQTNVKRIGLIGFSSAEMRSRYEQSLVDGLRDLGYVEGKNLQLVRRYADGDPARAHVIADELATLKLDAVVTTCTPTTRLMTELTQTTPLVMAAVSDPVGEGLIASYAKPGGNVTGLATQFEDIVGKMLELYAEAVPALSPVAVLFNPRNRVHKKFLEDLDRTGARLGVRVMPVEIALGAKVDAKIDAAARAGAVSVLALPDDTLIGHYRRAIIDAAARRRLPSFFGYGEAVEEGGLMSYGESRRNTYRRVAYYLDRLAKGANPGSLPVEQPTGFELTVNLKTAQRLGLTIPRSILLRADRVIE